MRALTREEIAEYIQFSFSEEMETPSFIQEQADLIGEVMYSRVLPVLVSRLRLAMATGLDPMNLLLSIYVWGFQMGRECESRLGEKANGQVGNGG